MASQLCPIPGLTRDTGDYLPKNRAPTTTERLDTVMNWVVGTLLVSAWAVLVFLQTR
jgi:hypothetical protein